MRAALMIGSIALALGSVQGGIYTDELSKCLVEKTSTDDRGVLVRWMFAAGSRHPAVSPLTSVTDAQIAEANQQVADLFNRLIGSACRSEASKALRFEGSSAIESGFTVLGEVAGRELFSAPEVAGVLSGLQEHIDVEQFKQLLQGDAESRE